MRRQALGIADTLKFGSILLTHHHEDHSGNADALRHLKKVSVYGHEVSIPKLRAGFRILLYQHVVWGRAGTVQVQPLPEKIEGSGCCLVPIHTPGHSRDHTVFFDRDNGRLFSGDLFLGTKIKYFRADERIADTIDSLKKVLSLDFDALFCCHNPQPAGGKAMLEKKLQYLEDLTGEIRTLLGKGYDRNAIMKALYPRYREATVIKYATFCNVSFANIIRSLERHQHD